MVEKIWLNLINVVGFFGSVWAESPSPALFTLMVLVCVLAFRFGFKRLGNGWVALFSSMSAAVMHTIFEMMVRGPSPLFLVGVILAFILLFPFCYLLAIGLSFALRRFAHPRKS